LYLLILRAVPAHIGHFYVHHNMFLVVRQKVDKHLIHSIKIKIVEEINDEKANDFLQMSFYGWNSQNVKMESSFAYVLIGRDQYANGDIVNETNEELDFQTHAYEVCVREVIYTRGAWGTIHNGFNWIDFKPKKDSPEIHTIPLSVGYYDTLEQICGVFNRAIAAYIDENKLYTMPHNNFMMVNKTMMLYWNNELTVEDTCEFYPSKQLAKMLGLKVDANGNVEPLTKNSVVVEAKCNFTVNVVDLLWLFGEFVHPTTLATFSLPIMRMIPVPIETDDKHMEHTIFSVPNMYP
jgi:hypothetical protein